MSFPRTSSWFGGGGGGAALPPAAAAAIRRARPSSRGSFINPSRDTGVQVISPTDGSPVPPQRRYNPNIVSPEEQLARDRRALVLVDVATEHGIDEERAGKVREVLSFARQYGKGGMETLAVAIRKRLKHPDEMIVLHTLNLLEELMRTVPNFFRVCANDKFFRRLWRFVVPNYKESYRGKLRFGRSAYDGRAVGTGQEPAERVQILLRAWAEELRRIYAGQYDQHARFFIDRYTTMRVKYQFPPVPPSDRPWIYDTAAARASSSTARSRSSQRAYAGSVASTALSSEAVPLGEIENTTSLFENMVEKASSADELRSDIFTELSQKCKVHLEDINKMTLKMDKDEDLARAVKLSERLRTSLTIYNKALATGRIDRPIPVVSNDDDAADEGENGYHKYGESADHPAESRSLPPAASIPAHSQQKQYDDSSDDKYDTAPSPPPEPAARKVKRKPAPSADAARNSKNGKKKVVVRKKRPAPASAGTNGPAPTASKPPVRRRKKVLVKKRSGEEGRDSGQGNLETLVSITKDGDEASEEGADNTENNAFEMLADREIQKAQGMYSTQNTATSTEEVDATISSQLQKMAIGGQQQPQQSQQAHAPQQAQYPPQPQAQPQYNPYAAPVPNNPYGGMMMIPSANPLALYGSMNPALLAAAYQTMNPAMYYGSVNPMLGAQANNHSGQTPSNAGQSSQAPSTPPHPSNGAQRAQPPPGPVPAFSVPFFPPQPVPPSASGGASQPSAEQQAQAVPQALPLALAYPIGGNGSGASASSGMAAYYPGAQTYGSYPTGVSNPATAYGSSQAAQSTDPYQNTMMMNAAAAYHLAAQQQAAAYAAYQSVNSMQPVQQPPPSHGSAPPTQQQPQIPPTPPSPSTPRASPTPQQMPQVAQRGHQQPQMQPQPWPQPPTRYEPQVGQEMQYNSSPPITQITKADVSSAQPPQQQVSEGQVQHALSTNTDHVKQV